MKIAYIAHPISGDIQGNLEKIKEIGRRINLEEPDVVPFVHYWFDCHALNDDIPEERERGIKNDVVLMQAGFIDEIWLYGGTISTGMSHEIDLAHKLGIKVVPKTPATSAEYKERWRMQRVSGTGDVDQAELNRLKANVEKLSSKLQDGRDYLMQVQPDDLTVEDALEAFGFGRNGTKSMWE